MPLCGSIIEGMVAPGESELIATLPRRGRGGRRRGRRGGRGGGINSKEQRKHKI